MKVNLSLSLSLENVRGMFQGLFCYTTYLLFIFAIDVNLIFIYTVELLSKAFL